MPIRSVRLRTRRTPRTVRERGAAGAERRARLVVRERSGGVCEGCGQARATDWAHRIAQGQGGPWCASNGIAMCREHHAWCHRHPAAARAKGWMLRSTDDHASTPALLAVHGWVLLRPDGSLTPVEAPP